MRALPIGTTTWKRRGLAASAATLVFTALTVGVTQTPAFAAYGAAKSCKLGSSTVTIQPYFTTPSSGMRQIGGYAFYTTPSRTITFVSESAFLAGRGDEVGYTQTNPNAPKGSRTNLSSKYKPEPAGTTTIDFTIKDAAGNSCWAGMNI